AVSPAGAATFSLTTTASPTAGNPFPYTTLFRSQYGNTTAGYAGTVHFTGGGTSPTLPANYTFVGGDNGAHTFTNGVTLTQAGNRTETQTANLNAPSKRTSGTMLVSPAGPATFTV